MLVLRHKLKGLTSPAGGIGSTSFNTGMRRAESEPDPVLLYRRVRLWQHGSHDAICQSGRHQLRQSRPSIHL